MRTLDKPHDLKCIESVLRDDRGVSLILVVFLMTALAVAGIGVLTMGAKLRSAEKERITPARLETVRKALVRYYLSHHDLPDPLGTSPQYTIPAKALNLPQEYRFDKDGQFIRYNCARLGSGAANIRGLTVRRNPTDAGVSVAAVLVAPGPDKVIDGSNQNTTTYSQYNVDDVVVGVSVEAEAMKIAARAVALLQAAAKAYDGQVDPDDYNAQFNRINNDGDTFYPDDCPCAPQPCTPPPPQPTPIIDENGYAAAEGGNGTGCIRYGKLINDPIRGTPTLNVCAASGGNPAADIAVVFGLSQRYATDPWGNAYRWGGGDPADSDTLVEDAQRNRRYWAFYSMGPDGLPNTGDDITPTTDRIVGDYATR